MNRASRLIDKPGHWRRLIAIFVVLGIVIVRQNVRGRCRYPPVRLRFSTGGQR